MNTDCKRMFGASALKANLKSVTGKTLTLSMALMLGACASTADKPVEAPAAEAPAPAKTAAPENKEPAPSAAELMKTLRAPLKEPASANETKTTSAEAPTQKQVSDNIAAKTEAVQQNAENRVEKVADGVASVSASKATEMQAKAATSVSSTSAKATATTAEVKNKAEVVVEQTAPQLSSDTPVAINAKPFSVTAKQLPFTFDIWTIRKGNTALTEGLVIVTPTWEMGKEGYMSQIWLTLMEDKIHINSSSDIETASKGLGIRIDGGDLIPFSSVAETNIGVIEGKWLDRLARAGKVDIYLGFFPGKKPTSDTFKSDLSLSNLDRVVATYRMLNR